ncbi:MAG: phage tailspike polysaccharide lyase family protein [Mesorhizobium sp.]
MAVQKANYIWRDFETDGVSASGFHKPVNREIRERGTWVENAINAGLSNGGLIYDTKASMNADLAHPANASAWVVDDATPANNGIYRKSGASGSGSWTKIAELPYSVIYAQNAGTGTANAVVATSSVPVSASAYSQLVSVPFTAANTSAMTLAINGETPRALVLNRTGAVPVPAGYIQPGMSALVQIDSDGNYRLFSYGDASAIQAVIEALLVEAQAARDAALSAQPQAFPVSRTALGALPDTTANAYLTEPGFEGYFKQVDATDPTLADLIAADAVGGDIKVSAGNPNLAYLRQRKYGDLIKTSEFGHDLTVALAVAGEQRKRFGPDARVDVLINQTGTLALSKAVQPPTGVNFFSDKRLVLDANSLANGDFYDSASGIIASGGRTVIDIRPLGGTSRADHYSAALPSFSTFYPGDIAVTFTAAHGLKVGDVVVWYDSADGSWFGERPEYRLSMRRRVVGVASSTKVYLDKPSRDQFVTSATCKAYKQTTMPGGRFGGWFMDLEGAATTGIQGVHLLGLDERTEVADIIAIGAGYSGIALAQCLNVRPFRLRGGTKMGTAGASVYPIQIQNCTDVRVRDSDGAGDWHTLAMTGNGGFDVGASINEDCWYEDCKAYNSGGSAVGSLEMHGNSDRCGFLNCEASEVILGGRDASAIGGTIDNAQTTTSGQAKLVYIGEQHSGRFLIHGTKLNSVKNTGTSSTSGAIYCYAGDHQIGQIFVDLVDVFLNAPNEQTPILIGRGVGNSAKFSFSFDGVVNIPAATTYGLVRVVNGSDSAVISDYFRIERAAKLASGLPWADFGNTVVAAFTEMSFPRQTVDWVTSNAGLPAEVSPVIPWKHGFPRGYVPKVSPQIQKGTLGPKANAHGYAVTNTGVQVEVATGDATNMVATATYVAIEGW